MRIFKKQKNHIRFWPKVKIYWLHNKLMWLALGGNNAVHYSSTLGLSYLQVSHSQNFPRLVNVESSKPMYKLKKNNLLIFSNFNTVILYNTYMCILYNTYMCDVSGCHPRQSTSFFHKWFQILLLQR